LTPYKSLAFRDLLDRTALRMELCRKALIELYRSLCYERVMPSSFELYDNLLDLVSPAFRRDLMSFQGPGGELLSLRGEMTVATVSLLKRYYLPQDRPKRFFYLEKLFRKGGERMEFYQAGVELIGAPLELPSDLEVLYLLFKSLDVVGLRDYLVLLGDSDVLAGVLARGELSREEREMLSSALSLSSRTALEEVLPRLDLPEGERTFLSRLYFMRGGEEVLEEAEGLLENPTSRRALARLGERYRALRGMGLEPRVEVDLSLSRELGFYSGLIFEVVFEGLRLGGGGRYDALLRRMGMLDGAVGFALELDLLAELTTLDEVLPERVGLWVDPHIPFEEVVLRLEALVSMGLQVELLHASSLEEARSQCRKRSIGRVCCPDPSGFLRFVDASSGCELSRLEVEGLGRGR